MVDLIAGGHIPGEPESGGQAGRGDDRRCKSQSRLSCFEVAIHVSAIALFQSRVSRPMAKIASQSLRSSPEPGRCPAPHLPNEPVIFIRGGHPPPLTPASGPAVVLRRANRVGFGVYLCLPGGPPRGPPPAAGCGGAAATCGAGAGRGAGAKCGAAAGCGAATCGCGLKAELGAVMSKCRVGAAILAVRGAVGAARGAVGAAKCCSCGLGPRGATPATPRPVSGMRAARVSPRGVGSAKRRTAPACSAARRGVAFAETPGCRSVRVRAVPACSAARWRMPLAATPSRPVRTAVGGAAGTGLPGRAAITPLPMKRPECDVAATAGRPWLFDNASAGSRAAIWI